VTDHKAPEKRPHVVVLGGGFAGLYAARALARAPVSVTVVDSRNHHLFQPLLYQVATAALSAGDIAVPIRRILRHQANASVVLAKALDIDTQAKRVTFDEGSFEYDFLIVATGATHSYFGHDAWQKDAPGLKSIEDALDIRRRVLLAYEEAEREPDPSVQREWLTFVVVGGGPTGVELAGALAEISRHVLERDFRRIDPASARIVLVEAGPRVLPAFTEISSKRAMEQLERLGAEVRTGARVTNIDARGVTLDGEHITARTVLWAAGVTASPLAAKLGAPLDRAGRVKVLPDLSVPGAPDVFVVGDLAALEQDGKLVPGVAQAAIQEGRHAAKNIVRRVRGGSTEPFHYRDKGELATIGRASAVAELGSLRLSGLFAWLVWLFVHILFLIGFRNRYIVLSEWAISYVTYERGARLITGGKRSEPPLLP
jgi:NADH:ubiquinone reductase (H+-translocating)